MRLTLISVAAVFGMACSESALHNFDADVQDHWPAIALSPENVDFGELRADDEATESVTVTNVGEDVLRVEDITLSGASSFFLDATDGVPERLAPGESAAFVVGFVPLGARDLTADVVVSSDDPDVPQAHVALTGFGAVPALSLDPAAYDFGTLYMGCEDTVDLTLSNVGTDDLVITAIDMPPAGPFALGDPNQLPLTLAPGQATGVQVSFYGDVAGDFAAQVNVSSNDPREVVTAQQDGTAAYALSPSDHFEMPSDPPVDILFAIDQSCSMDAHSANLAANFSTFISELGAVTDNWQVGVVTLDTGCINDTVFRATTTGLLSRFTQAVGLGFDAQVALDEQLFRLAQLAMSRTGPGQCNAGFLRPDALLHVVLVSDEWEQSGIDPGLFVSNLQTYKARPSLLKVSGILCPAQGCPWADGSNAGYAQAVALSGGEQLDVLTSNWGQSAQVLADASTTGVGRFGLTQHADPASVVVSVDGVPWSSGWHFDATTNELVFDTLPPVGAQIDVAYGALVSCR